MDSTRILACPVCGTTRNMNETSEYACKNCGFSYAYIPWCAGEKSRNVWLKQVEEAKKRWRLAKQIELAEANCLTVGSDFISFLSPKTQCLYQISGYGELKVENHVVQISSGTQNYAIVYKNGTVKVVGSDNTYGQQNTDTWSDIKFVLAAPNCTYGVNEKGTVYVAGTPIDPAIRTWNNIKKLVCGNTYVAGLQKDGKVLLAGTMPDASAAIQIDKWTQVSDITASNKWCVALHKNNTVSFAGKSTDNRKAVEDWKNLIKLSSDSVYLVALTKQGEILEVGSCRASLDKGRSLAVNWKDVMAISCNQSGIGALCASGELLFAGTISGDIQVIKQVWMEKVKPIVLADVFGLQ